MTTPASDGVLSQQPLSRHLEEDFNDAAYERWRDDHDDERMRDE